jgi:hypothetical protein
MMKAEYVDFGIDKVPQKRGRCGCCCVVVLSLVLTLLISAAVWCGGTDHWQHSLEVGRRLLGTRLRLLIHNVSLIATCIYL